MAIPREQAPGETWKMDMYISMKLEILELEVRLRETIKEVDEHIFGGIRSLLLEKEISESSTVNAVNCLASSMEQSEAHIIEALSKVEESQHRTAKVVNCTPIYKKYLVITFPFLSLPSSLFRGVVLEARLFTQFFSRCIQGIRVQCFKDYLGRYWRQGLFWLGVLLVFSLACFGLSWFRVSRMSFQQFEVEVEVEVEGLTFIEQLRLQRE